MLGRLFRVIVVWEFKLAWLILRTVWYLSVFLVLSLGAGIGALAKRNQKQEDMTAGFGEYSEDGQRWRDEASGQWYPCSPVDREYCQIQASSSGFYWRMTALWRLMRRGAAVRHQFSAVTESTNGASPEVVATRDFPQEAKRDITLDHVDPALASTDPYGLADSREAATTALNGMDWLLTKKGWKQVKNPEATREHWYAHRYVRPVILWDKPIGEAPSVAGITAA